MCRLVLAGLCLCSVSTRLSAVELLFDFEGDAGLTAIDKLGSDGTQNGTLINNVSITSPGLFGNQSALFDIPEPRPLYSTLEIPDTNFGSDFSLTFAAFLDNREEVPDFTRIMSSFRGTGPVGTDRILFDMDPRGESIPGLRAIINNEVFTTQGPPAGMSDPGYHHYALVLDGLNGQVDIYFDGARIDAFNSEGFEFVGTGYTNTMNIFLGEDPHDGGGSANEQFIGQYDEVLLINRALDATAIGQLAAGNPVSSVVTPEGGERAVYYDFEGDSGQTATDRFAADGGQNGILVLNSGIDTDPADARLGDGSARFDAPGPAGLPFSLITTDITGTDLGDEFTVSATINVPGGGHANGGLTRLFSTFGGSGSAAGRFLFDFNPLAADGALGVRMILPDGTNLTLPDTFSLNEDHTLSATLAGGELTIYLDGSEIGTTITTGAAVDLGEFLLQIGEDLGGAINENFIGRMDDVLILGEALSAEDILMLHTGGACAVVDCGGGGFLPGDFDKDGDVDGDDFLTWQSNFGTSTGATQASGDSDGDGDVDGDDFLAWQSNFGSGGGAAAGSVPEPSSALLVLLGMLSVAARRRPIG